MNRSLRRNLLRRLLRDPAALTGVVIIILLFVSALIPQNWIDPLRQNLSLRLSPPGRGGFPLGSDHFGRDVMARLISGAAVSLKVGVIASFLSLIIGVFLGTISGYFGRRWDTVIMRFTDMMLGFPVLLFLIAIAAAFEPGIRTATVAIGCVTWPGMARVVRGQILALKTSGFIQAATAMGYSHRTIIFRHILPNTMAPVIVIFTLSISGAIMAEASLSFLGLGVQPPTASWGAMINEGKDFLRVAPWLSFIPGAAIAVTVLGFNLLGEALRDAMDVKIPGRR